MRNMLFSVVLYSIAHAAAATPCGTPATADDEVEHLQARITQTTRTEQPLMKIAARETVQATAGPAAMQKVVHTSAAPVQIKSEVLADGDPQPRAKTAMLIAALAVMLTIALRRAGSSDQ